MTAYKVGVNVPPGIERDVMDAVDAVVQPLYPGYRRCFSWWTVRSTWTPMDGSHPFIGTPGEAEETNEVRIEFAVREDDLKAAVSAIRRVHPYEEPAIDVIPMVPWKNVLERY